MIKMILVWALAALFTTNGIWLALRTNYTTGNLMVWLISAGLVLYGIFHRAVDSFLAQGFGRVVKWTVAGGLAIFVGLFVFVAVSGYAGGARGDEKAIIVLGAGLRGERVSDVLRRRLAASLEAWQKNPQAVLVVTGGQGLGESIPEAVAMCRWLEERGVPAEKIITEDKSTSTEENLLFARQLLAQAGIDSDQPVAVVSNAFHCYRAGQYAKKLGYTQVRTVPASMNLGTLLPSYMREVLAVLFLWVFRRGPITG